MMCPGSPEKRVKRGRSVKSVPSAILMASMARSHVDTFARREKMLKLREELLAIEEDRLAGRAGTTPDELNSYPLIT